MQSPEIFSEDGMLPRFTGPNYYGSNNILIVRVPDELRKPEEPRFQLATNPLCEQKVTSDFPATNLLRSMLPKPPEKSSDNTEFYPKCPEFESNSNMEKEDDIMDVNVKEVPENQNPETLQRGTYRRRNNRGRSRPSYQGAPRRNNNAERVQPWANQTIAYCMQNHLPLQLAPNIQHHPFPNPNHQMRPPLINHAHHPGRFPSQVNFHPNQYPSRESYAQGHMPEPYTDGHMPEPYTEGHMPEPYTEGHMPEPYTETGDHMPEPYTEGHIPEPYAEGHIQEPYAENRVQKPYAENHMQELYERPFHKPNFQQAQDRNTTSCSRGFQNRHRNQNHCWGGNRQNNRFNRRPFQNRFP